MKALVGFIILMGCASAYGASNQSIVYQGRILRPDGTTPNSGNITFTLAVYSPSPTNCLLYSETQTVNMTGSAGMFSLPLGQGTRVDGGAHSFSKIFVNGGSFTGLTCGNGATSYSPVATDDRNLIASFNDAGTAVTLSAMEIKSVPFALQAHEIAGWGVNNLVKVSSIGSPTTFTTAEMAVAKTLTGLSCASNEIIKFNGTSWACSADATGGSPSDAGYGSLNKGVVAFDTNAATSGITVASGLAKLSDTGVAANTYGSATAVPSITVNAQGRITAASSTTIAIPVSQLTQSGAANGEVLKWNGTAWAPAADATGTSPGDASYAAKGLVQGLTDAATSGLTIASGVISVNAGTGANQIVKLDSSGKLPAVDGSALTNITATGFSGVLPIANGGTNSSTALVNDRIMVTASGKIVEAAAMNDGQILIGDTGGAPVVASVGQSNGISITAGAGTLSIATNATANNTASTIVSRDASGNFAAGAVSFSSTVLRGSTSGTLTMAVPTTVTSYTLTWPSAVGGAGSFLTTDASGNLSWGSPAAVADASYAAKGAVQGLTDASTSGLNIASGVISVNSGTGANQIVKLNGSSQIPAVDGSLLTNLSAGNIASGVLPIARGGTNNGSLGVTAGGILYMDGSKAMTTAAGTSGQALISAGAGAPAFGTLGVGGGGTGQASFAPNSLIMANVTGTQLTGMTCSPGQILKWNAGGTAWECTADATGTAPGDASYAAKGIVQFDTDAATSGVSVTTGVAKVNTGTGANQIVKLNGSSQLPGVDGSLLTNLSTSQLSTGTLPIARGGTNSGTALTNNKVMVSSGGAIVEGNGFGSTNTASTYVMRDASGNFAAGAITNDSNILKGATSGTLTMAVPTTVTSYTLTWPAAVGGAGSFLTTDASGNLSWGSPAAVADASYAAKGAVQGLTDAATSGLIISSGVISVNAGTGANQIVKLNGSSQLPAVDGSLLTNLSAGNIASGVLPIARGGTNNGSLGVTAGGMLYADGSKLMTTAAGTSGQAMISSGAGAPAFGTLGFAGGGTGATSFTAHGLIIANAGGTALTSMTCANNEILKWNGTSWDCATDATGTSPGDASYAAKGIVQFDTDASTSGVSVTTGVAKVNTGTGANQIVKLNGTAQLPALDGSLLTNLNSGAVAAAGAFVNGGNTATATATLGTNSNHNLEIETNGSTRMSILNDGKVGVGTTSPLTSLDVNGTIRAGTDPTSGADLLTSRDSTSNTQAWAVLGTRYSSGGFFLGYGVKAGTTLANPYLSSSALNNARSLVHVGEDIEFITAPTQTTAVGSAITSQRSSLTIKSSGFVGFGNTDPSTVVDFSGAITQRGMAAPSNSPAGQGRIYFDSTSNKFRVSQNGAAYVDLVPGATADASYSTKGIVQGLTDAATSGLNINSGVISVNSGTGANQVVKLDGTAKLPAVDGSALTNLNVGNFSSGVLPIARGGTNNGSLGVTDGGIVYADGTSLQTTAAGTTGQAFISQGTGIPTWGTLGVAGGGTGLTAGTSGGIPYYDSTSTMASSTLLTANGVVLGGGAGGAPSSTGAGSAYQVLRVPAGGGTPAFGSIDLSQSAAVTGTLAIGNGGTGVTALTPDRILGTTVGGALSFITCSQNQVLSFNASGVYGCYNVNSIFDGFLNGGNTVTATATLGTNSAHNLEFETGGTTRLTLNTSGQLGIGVSPTRRLDVAETFTQTSGTNMGTYFKGNVSPTANSTGSYYTQFIDVNTDGAGAFNLAALIGSATDVYHTGTGTLGNGYATQSSLTKQNAGTMTTGTGHSASITNLNGGTIGNGYAVKATATNSSTGTFTTAYGGDFWTSRAGTGSMTTASGARVGVNNTATGTLPTAIGLDTSVLSSAGTITDGYGIKIGNIQSTNKWAIHSSDGNAESYFAGNVGIGIANPAYRMDVNQTTLTANSFVDVARFGESNSGAGVALGYIVNSGGTAPRSAHVTVTASNVNLSIGPASYGEAIYILDSNGFIGLGATATTPTSLLDINGAITQRGMAAPAVSPAGQGRIYFDSTANKFRVSQNGAAYTDLVSSGTTADASYAAKGLVQGLTDAATSGLTISSGVISVNSGTGANQIVKLDGSSRLPAVDGSNLTNLDVGDFTAGVLPIARGGTNNGSLGVTAGGVAYGDGSKLMMSAAGTSGQALISAGAGVPAFGTLGADGGGTGQASYTAGDLLYATGATTLVKLSIGATGTVLRSNGTAPGWVTPNTAGFFYNGGNSFAGSAILGTNNNENLEFETNATTKMTIEPGGDVGIGITNPLQALHINRTTGPSYVVADSGDNDAGFQAYGARGVILLNDDGAAADAKGKTIMSDSGKLLIGKVNDAWTVETTHMTIDNDGKVGVGTATPNSKVEAYSSIAANWDLTSQVNYSQYGLRTISNYNGGATGEGRIGIAKSRGVVGGPTPVLSGDKLGTIEFLGYGTSYNQSATIGAFASQNHSGTAAGGELSFSTAADNSVSVTERMRIDQKGYVGVGTNTPRAHLDVNGAIVSKPALSIAAGTVDYVNNNLAYTSQSCRAFALHNLKDGGSYTLAVLGTTSAECTFTAFSDAGTTALTVKLPPDHTATLGGKATVYTFLVLGTTVFASWVPGY